MTNNMEGSLKGKQGVAHPLLLPYINKALGKRKLPSIITRQTAKALPAQVLNAIQLPMVLYKYGDATGRELFTYLTQAKNGRKNPFFRLMEGKKSKTTGCTCAKFHPKYRMPGADHVATTNFEILDDPVLEEIFGMGPSMRFKGCENWVEGMMDYVTKKLTDFQRELINNGIDRREAEKLIQEIATQVSNIFEEAEDAGEEDAKEMPDLNKRPHYTWIDGRNPCAPLVVTPLDKFGDRFGLVCKCLYDHLMFEWLEGPSYQKETNMS